MLKNRWNLPNFGESDKRGNGKVSDNCLSTQETSGELVFYVDGQLIMQLYGSEFKTQDFRIGKL